MTGLCPGKEMAVKDAKDLDSAVFRRLVTRRARQLFEGAELEVPTDEDKRRESEARIEQYYERIHKGADFLPARFLADGAEKVRAVCRISTPTSYGTGFLIGRGYLMTNNHVLSSKDEAGSSVAEFEYENEQSIRRVAIEPDRLFVTDKDLDFTIVACDDQNLKDIEPVPLLRNPATVTRNERVNIIQHPRARPKEVTLHENRVTRVKDKVIWYQTDTEPGSSGSPVFNNNWELVGLHHAGWQEIGGAATNEGIRIAAIVSHLLRLVYRASPGQESFKEILGNVTDTSPYLGFFDVYGVSDPGGLEIEIPDFGGTPEFADVGVWNIEHFNDQIPSQRVENVADVVARLSMDVLGLVEVQRGAMDQLVSALGRRGFSMGYEIYDVTGSQDLAILYDRDTTSVTMRNDITQRHSDRLNAKTQSGKTAFPRLPLFAECTVGDGDGKVKFMMALVHLKAYGDAQSRARRRLAAQVLAEIVADIRDREGLSVVLGGDFNERLDNDVLAAIKDSPDLFAMTADDASNDAISYVGSSHRSLIDHILVSSDVRLGDISGDDAAIVRLDRSVWDFAGKVSDHVPVVFRMVYRDEPIDIEPSRTVPDVIIPVPEGTMKVHLSFESS